MFPQDYSCEKIVNRWPRPLATGAELSSVVSAEALRPQNFTMRRLHRATLSLSLALLALISSAVSISHPPLGKGSLTAPSWRKPEKYHSGAGSQPYFDFHSGFWINLDHFLYLQAVLDTSGALQDRAVAAQRTLPVRQMTPEQHATWEKALAYYRQFGDSDPLWDRALIIANYELSDADNAPSLAGRRLPPEMIAALEEAAPVYRALWWSDQDRKNRQWIGLAARLVREYGETMARRIASIYQTQWPKEEIPVEVVLYANWAGAYTTTINSTLITVSSADPANQADAALEVLFHEASHALIGSVRRALEVECKTEHLSLHPPTLWHAVLFYTTGELVKDLIPGYTPYAEANGLWARAWPMYLPVLRRDWRPYLDGRITFHTAIRRMVRDAGEPAKDSNGKLHKRASATATLPGTPKQGKTRSRPEINPGQLSNGRALRLGSGARSAP
jgi:hypothetical protein